MDDIVRKDSDNLPIPKRTITDEAKLKISVFEKVKSKPSGIKKTEWLKQVGKSFDISLSTVRRYVSDVDNNTIKRERNVRGVSAWDPEALSWMKGFYLKAIDEVGECSKAAAYRATVQRAGLMSWKIGSAQSAYQHLQQLHPLLTTYARGGNRALDNYFYILRNLEALRPMQIIVGDQHIFNWWVCDYETGRIFRMTGYLWLDMATRTIYGIAFDEKYNYKTVKRALKVGLLRFGKFECTYNDNGKPEISRAMNDVINELQAWGMRSEDLSELYRTDAGYAVEDPSSDEVLDYVQTPEAWRKYNRRILAKVKNAKAKPIETFFRTLEKILVDMCLPGLVRNINASAPEDEKATARLKKQRDNGLLLSPEGFQEKVIEALETYETRRHSSLKMSPREKLMERVNQGWEPTKIQDADLNFIFMERIDRKVTSGKIVIGNELYEGEELRESHGFIDSSIGITQFEGKTLQVRFDSDADSDKAYAVAPDGSIRPLFKVKKYEMLNDEDVDEAISRKRRQMKAVRTAFNNLIGSVEGSIIKTPRSKIIEDANQRNTLEKENRIKIDNKNIEEEVEKRVADSKKIIQFGEKKKIYATPGERYKSIIAAEICSTPLSPQDRIFKQTFEAALSEAEKLYWDEYRRMISG